MIPYHIQPTEDLEAILQDYGLFDSYRKWNEQLSENGFEIIDLSKSSLIYRYVGHFAVKGDHADDVFSLFSRVKDDGLIIEYRSSRLTNWYLELWEDPFANVREKGLQATRSFLDRQREFIGDNHCRIQLNSNGHFQIRMDENFLVYYARAMFIKLAVMLDYELCKEHPFDTI